MRSRWSLPLVLAAVVAAPAFAQPRPAAAPKRPRLGAADTNDARAYLDFGNRLADSDPGTAADAFYWAARIDPGLAEAYYGRRIALLLRSESLLRKFMLDRDQSAKEFGGLDSLQFRAVTLNPFLYRRLDITLLRTYYRNAVEAQARRVGGTQPMRAEIDHEIESYLSSAGSYMRGWMAYGRSDFTAALGYYADAMKRQKEKAGLRVERGRIFGMRGDVDSALVELRLALADLRAKESKDVVVLYNSKAVIEQAIGMLLEGRDDVAGAREAYGRALEEDLAYWPAHVRLGMLAIAAKDTATAMSELTLAAQIAPDDAYAHHLVGWSFATLGKVDEAMTALQKSATLEPYYALPHIVLGRIYDAAGYTEEAVASYRAFLARASRADPQREVAERRIAAIANGATP